MVVFKMNLQ